MAEQVTGWKSNSGKFFSTKGMAEMEDTGEKLVSLFRNYLDINDLNSEDAECIRKFISENKTDIKEYIKLIEGFVK